MDFNVKKLVRDAGTALSRVVQLTEEKLGTSEKTELDAHFENLAERSDTTKQWTEKILSDTEAVLTPNPGNRVEDYLFDKIEKKRPNRLSNLEYLGLDMIEAGNEFGPGTAYGSALIKVGQCEQRLGHIERDFIASANHCFLNPLRKFLDGEMKTILKERGILESKRLDLDACKNRVRKARSMIGQPTSGDEHVSNLLFNVKCVTGKFFVSYFHYLCPCSQKEGPSPEFLLEQAERDLRIAQSEFDRQAEITKLLLEGVSSSHTGHLRCLHEFAEAQTTYYAQCHKAMQEMKDDLASLSMGVNSNASTANQNNTSPPMSATSASRPTPAKRARVLCDYDAKDSSELSLMTDEVITVYNISPTETDYMLGERGNQQGKVPTAFLELIN